MSSDFLLKSQMKVVAHYREVLAVHALDLIERERLRRQLKDAETRLERWLALSLKPVQT